LISAATSGATRSQPTTLNVRERLGFIGGFDRGAESLRNCLTPITNSTTPTTKAPTATPPATKKDGTTINKTPTTTSAHPILRRDIPTTYEHKERANPEQPEHTITNHLTLPRTPLPTRHATTESRASINTPPTSPQIEQKSDICAVSIGWSARRRPGTRPTTIHTDTDARHTPSG
jgi:hypothetical protein